MKRILQALLCLALLSTATAVQAADRISLSDCETAALNYSRRIKALANEVKSAESAAESAKTATYPSLVLEANVKYITALPKFFGMEFGDNWNYSAGPALYWTAFDGNVKRKNYESMEKLAQSKKFELEYEKKQLILNVRQAYFMLISSLATLDLLNQQLALAQAQNRDVRKGIEHGIKNKLDGVLSDSDVLQRQSQIKSAQISVTDCIKILNDLTGNAVSFDFEKYASQNSWKELFDFDSLKDLLDKFLAYLSASFDENNSSAASLEMMSKYYETLAGADINSNYPVINIYAKSTMDHPNGPLVETFNQNTAGASFSMPLYQFGRNKKAAESGRYSAASYEEQKLEVIENMRRLFDSSKKKIAILAAQKDLSADVVDRTKTAAELMFSSYMAGESRFLDVENLNVKVLEAKTSEINIYAQMLTQLAIIASLSAAALLPEVQQ